MIHSSFKSLGKIEEGAAGIFDALKDFLGEEGTMLLPAFSYDSVGPDNPVFDRKTTPSCIGFLPEYFHQRIRRHPQSARNSLLQPMGKESGGIGKGS